MKKMIIITAVLLLLAGCSAEKNATKPDGDFFNAYKSYEIIGNGIYIVGNGENFGVVDSKTGSAVIEVIYDKIKNIDGSLLLVCKDGKYSVFTVDGSEYSVLGEFENVRPYQNSKEQRLLTYKGGFYTLMSTDGATLTDFGSFDHLMLDTKNNDRYVIQRGTLFTVIDENGDQLSVIGRYNELEPDFENERYIVTRDAKKGVVNAKGTPIIEISWDNIWKSRKNGSYVVEKNNKFGVKLPNGKTVLPVKYEGIDSYELLFHVTFGSKHGLVGLDGSVIEECVYDGIEEITSDQSSFACTLVNGGERKKFSYGK